MCSHVLFIYIQMWNDLYGAKSAGMGAACSVMDAERVSAKPQHCQQELNPGRSVRPVLITAHVICFIMSTYTSGFLVNEDSRLVTYTTVLLLYHSASPCFDLISLLKVSLTQNV